MRFAFLTVDAPWQRIIALPHILIGRLQQADANFVARP